MLFLWSLCLEGQFVYLTVIVGEYDDNWRRTVVSKGHRRLVWQEVVTENIVI